MRIPEATTICRFDDRRLKAADLQIGIDEPTLSTGMGLFETMSVRDGHALDLEAHLARLAAGAARLELSCPPLDMLRNRARAAAGELEVASGWLKLILIASGRTILFGGAEAESDCDRETTAVLLPWRRNLHDPLAGLKTLNYAPNVIGLNEARRRGADEGIWLNTRGHLAEGCTSNLFLVEGRKLFTPGESDGILPGIVRGLALRVARRMGLAVHEGKLRLRRLERAREAFLTSSVRGVRPLIAVDGRVVGRGEAGAITRAIQDGVKKLRNGNRPANRSGQSACAAQGSPG